MKRIIFMGTPEFSVASLKALYSNEDIEVSLVVTGQDKKRSRNKYEPTPVKRAALDLGLETIEPKNVNSPEILDKIFKIDPDYIVVIAYGQLIGDKLLNRFKDRIINIHSSLLPKYRGAAPMQFAILNRETKTGVCSMLIEKSMDTGDILICKELELGPKDNIELVHDRLSDFSKDLIVKTILEYDDLYKNRIRQDDSKATYTKKITKDMGRIDFKDKADTILGKLLAFSAWPGVYTVYKNQNLKIHNITIIDKYNNVKEGEIFKVDNDGIYVNCNDKCLILTEIQFPGKKRMSLKQYLLGNTIDLGAEFN